MTFVERRYSHHLAVLTPFADRVKKLARESLYLDILQIPHKSRWNASCTFVRPMVGSSGGLRLITVHQPLRTKRSMTAAVVLSARKWNGGRNLHPRIAKFPAERRLRPFKPRRTLYMYLEDDQAMVQRLTPPTHGFNVDHNSSCLLWIIYIRLQVESYRRYFLAFLLRLTIASFASSLMTYI
jgi:hypothetical protein